jgi:hypothetical protein
MNIRVVRIEETERVLPPNDRLLLDSHHNLPCPSPSDEVTGTATQSSAFHIDKRKGIDDGSQKQSEENQATDIKSRCIII